MAVGRVQSKGQITLPKSVREEAHLETGDMVLFKVLGPSQVEVQTISVKPLSYFIERYRVDAPYDDKAIREEWQRDAWKDVIGE